MIRAAILALLLALVGRALGAPQRKPAACKRTKWRLIGTERVPWEHDVDDHEWDEFEHERDECVPPPC